MSTFVTTMGTTRKKIIKIRVRDDEYKTIWQRALDLNTNISEYVRTLTLNDCKK